MTHDEMERAFEFMVQHQVKLEQFQVESDERHARFEVSVQRSIDSILQQQAQFAAGMMKIKELGGELAKSQVRMQNALADLAESHKQLAESHKDLAESHKQLAESHKQLAASQQMTEERLRSVLKALERGFGGNGRSRKNS
jgi:septal ring factor EnvC (AmiA/AmiB activator)